jgi:hypothetical protein
MRNLILNCWLLVGCCIIQGENISLLEKLKQNVCFSLESKNDGVGASLHQVLYSMGYAHYHKLIYLGIGKNHVSHHVPFSKVLCFLFGEEATTLTKSFYYQNSSCIYNTVNVGSFTELDENVLRRKDNIHYHFNNCVLPLDWKNKLNQYFSTSFLLEIQTNVLLNMISHPLFNLQYYNFDNILKKVINIAIHLRRGDIRIGDKYRWVSLQFYEPVINQILLLYPNAAIHLFSSVLKHKQYQNLMKELKYINFTTYNHISYEGGKNGKNEIESTQDVITTLSHFITADILITGKSSFSLSAALLNPNCIIYTPYHYHEPLAHWIQLTEDKNSDNNSNNVNALLIQNKLLKCLNKL